jgi:hypothetical protein
MIVLLASLFCGLEILFPPVIFVGFVGLLAGCHEGCGFLRRNQSG